MRCTSGGTRGQPQAAGPVGLVLPPRQGGGEAVGRRLRQGVDAGATGAGGAIRVQGQEQRRLPPPRQLDPVAERDEDVARAGQRHPAAAAGLQLPLQLQRRGQGDALLLRPARADGAGILAAMAGVQHHQRQRPARHRGGGQAAAIGQPGESGRRPGRQARSPAVPGERRAPAAQPVPPIGSQAVELDHAPPAPGTAPPPPPAAAPAHARAGWARSSSSRGGSARAVNRQAVGRSSGKTRRVRPRWIVTVRPAATAELAASVTIGPAASAAASPNRPRRPQPVPSGVPSPASRTRPPLAPTRTDIRHDPAASSIIPRGCDGLSTSPATESTPRRWMPPCGMPRRSPMVICPGGARCRRRFGRSRADMPFPHPWGPNPWGQSMRRAAYARLGVRGLLPHPRFAGPPDRVPPSRAGPVRPSSSPRDLSRQDPWQPLMDRGCPWCQRDRRRFTRFLRASRLARGHEPGALSRATAARRLGAPGSPWLPRRKRTGRRRMPYARAAQSSLTGSRHPDPPCRAEAPPGAEQTLR